MIILSTPSCEKIVRKIDVHEMVSFLRMAKFSLPSGQLHPDEIRLSCLTLLVQFHLKNLPERLIPDELRLEMPEKRKRRIFEVQMKTEGPIKVKKHT